MRVGDRWALLVWVLLLAGFATPASGHSPNGDPGSELLVSLVGMAMFCVLWLAFIRGGRSALRTRRSWLFHGGLLIGVFAIWGPLDHWASESASAHMIQHMLFISLMAPLLVVSRPLPQIFTGLGVSARSVGRTLKLMANRPMALGYLHGLTIWVWHLPFFYVLALNDPWVHFIEHLSFIATATLFWWAILNSATRNLGLSLCSLLFTLMHTGILGAILTFAREPLYGDHYALGDQQLAGLIMWVVGSFPYVAASIWIMWAGYQRLQKKEPSDLV
ncbi:cytochrome c oxidase assembly protein [Marinobacter sp.]|uniref:cytochrome c oxidase assembly protein n=1 Tax=Marinobacter sp. TaxID=50741 RepID=UPI0034A3BB06